MTDDRPFLPYGRQSLDEDDIRAVTDALRSDFLTTGPTVTAFEEAAAKRVGAKYASACANGTAALHLGALALGLKPGDHLIVPSITFLATANAARFVGAEVIFSDVDPETGLMRTEDLERVLAENRDKKIAAVAPVHLAGQAAAPEGIAELARRHGLKIMEDACHAVGSTYGEHPSGGCRHGDLAVTSFHPVKTITSGEGGMLFTNDENLDKRIKLYRNHGMTRDPEAYQHREMAFDADGSPNPWYYEMGEVGLNYRLSDLNCALGLSQLAKLDRFIDRRRTLADRYDALLGEMGPLIQPVKRAPDQNPAWHLYPARIDFPGLGLTRAEAMNRLRVMGIGTQVHYIPVHAQPYYRQRYGEIALPGAAAYYARTLSLPLFPAMGDADPERVADALAALLPA